MCSTHDISTHYGIYNNKESKLQLSISTLHTNDLHFKAEGHGLTENEALLHFTSLISDTNQQLLRRLQF